MPYFVYARVATIEVHNNLVQKVRKSWQEVIKVNSCKLILFGSRQQWKSRQSYINYFYFLWFSISFIVPLTAKQCMTNFMAYVFMMVPWNLLQCVINVKIMFTYKNQILISYVSRLLLFCQVNLYHCFQKQHLLSF